MGELSFVYNFKPWRRLVRSVKYRHQPATEYGLSFQRYAALFDASIFNSPVAITKVATGLSAHSSMKDLFASKKAVTIAESSSVLGADYKKHSTVEHHSEQWALDADCILALSAMLSTILSEDYVKYYARTFVKDRNRGMQTALLQVEQLVDDKGLANESPSLFLDPRRGVSDAVLLPYLFVFSANVSNYFCQERWLRGPDHEVCIMNGVSAAPVVPYKILNRSRNIFANASLFRPLPPISHDQARKEGCDNLNVNKIVSGSTSLNQLGGIDTILTKGRDRSACINALAQGSSQQQNFDAEHQNLNASPFRDGYLNAMPQIAGAKQNNITNVFYTLMSQKAYFRANAFATALAYAHPPIDPVIVPYQVFGKLADYPYAMNVGAIMLANKANLTTNIPSYDFATLSSRKSDVFKSTFAQIENNVFSVVSHASGKKNALGNITHFFEHASAETQQKASRVFDNISARVTSRSLSAFVVLSLAGSDRYGQIVSDPEIRGVMQEEACDIIDILQASNFSKHFEALDAVLVKTYGKSFALQDFIGATAQEGFMHTLQGVATQISNSELDVARETFFGRSRAKQFDPIDQIFASKDDKMISIYRPMYAGTKGSLSMNVLQTYLARQDGQEFSIFNMFDQELMNVLKDSVLFNPFVYEQSSLADGRHNRIFSILKDDVLAHKISARQEFYESLPSLDKAPDDYTVFDTVAPTHKVATDARWQLSLLHLCRPQAIIQYVNPLLSYDKKQRDAAATTGMLLWRKAVAASTHRYYAFTKIFDHVYTAKQLWAKRPDREAFESTGAFAASTSRNIFTDTHSGAKDSPFSMGEFQADAYGKKQSCGVDLSSADFLRRDKKDAIPHESLVALIKPGRNLSELHQLLLDTNKRIFDRYAWTSVQKNTSANLKRFAEGVMTAKVRQAIMQDFMTSVGKSDKLMDCLNQLFVDVSGKRVARHHGEFASLVYPPRKSSAGLLSLFDSVFVSKLSSDMSLFQDVVDTMTFKLGSSLTLWDEMSPISDSSYNVYTDTRMITLGKLKKDMMVYEEYWIARQQLDMYLNLKDMWISKDSSRIELLPWVIPIFRDAYMMDIYNHVHLTKSSHDIPSAIDVESVFRRLSSLSIYGTPEGPLWEEVSGAVVPIYKNRQQGFIDNITSLVKKAIPGGLLLKQDLFASTIPHNAAFNTDTFFDKVSLKTWMDYENEMIIKSQLHSAIHDGVAFVMKGRTHAFLGDDNKMISASKLGRYATHADQLFVDKLGNEAVIKQTSAWASKNGKLTFEEDTYVATQKIGDRSEYFDQIFLERAPHLCYYDYGRTRWASIQPHSVQAEQARDLGFQKEKNAYILDFTTPGTRQMTPVFYDEYVLSDKVFRESSLANQLDWMKRVNAKCGIHPNDFGNWAWVYETPDPFQQNPFGIDELLIPENDIRYENFEELIFNKEYMRPRNPVKIINDTTFIAKFPSKHPIKKFQDIGLDYEAGAIKFQNYFGVETEVMHAMFLRFYRIWQSKIFQFATMSMQQAVNQMLEYLFAWIPEYFPLEQVEQAYRVLKMIRWYGETAIIRNSQYIVSYELDTLQTTMKDGHCEIPNNLQCEDPASTNNTMFVDSSLRVIRNDPAQLGSDAYVELYIDNKRNTTISFSLANTIGSVYVYLNGTLIDVQSTSALNLVYSIPFTGDVNTVRIEKPAAHNLNSVFYIGNIRVEKMSYKNLTVEFDPQLKAGNKPLNEIALKLVQFANLKDDRDRAYREALESNLGLSEMYKKLLDYWNLHHQNKTKGKRLTIKEI